MTAKPLEHAVDGLFIVGLLSILLKGGDLFLREHQRFQEALDAATVYLEDLRPLAWFQKVSSKGFVISFVVITRPVLAYGLFFVSSDSVELWD